MKYSSVGLKSSTPGASLNSLFTARLGGFLLTLILLSSLVSAADLDLKAKAGMKASEPFYFADVLFDDLSLFFNNNVDAKLRIAGERFAEGTIENNQEAINKGNKLLFEVETFKINNNLSASTQSELVLTRVIKRIADNREERNQTLPSGLVVAFARVQILSGRIVEEQNLSDYKQLKIDCNLRGNTFVACGSSSNSICGPPQCLSPDNITLPIQLETVNISNECNRLKDFVNSIPSGASCSSVKSSLNNLVGKGLFEACARTYNISIADKPVFDYLVACKDIECQGNSSCNRNMTTSCSFNNEVIPSGQFRTDVQNNKIVQCRLGVLVQTERKSILQSIFGGSS